jgi:alkylhydroperoxidase family enzyme
VRGHALARAAAWRETPYFTDAERAALALTEAATRLADHPDAVSDEVWEDAARHYDERQLGALVLEIAAINAWNRINATTRQITGEWVNQWIPGAGETANAA